LTAQTAPVCRPSRASSQVWTTSERPAGSRPWSRSRPTRCPVAAVRHRHHPQRTNAKAAAGANKGRQFLVVRPRGVLTLATACC
jgi:hypothetical protein